MRTPYQCLKLCGKVLIAARGSNVDLFNMENGSLSSTWECPSTQEPNTITTAAEVVTVKPSRENTESSLDCMLDSSFPATKRRKLSASGENAQILNATEGKSKAANDMSHAAISSLRTSSIIALAVTNESRHVIAITGEDKSVRVLENVLGGGGEECLRQLSQRVMPKRPCAVALSEDDSTIVIADKFGDVYSLPLLVSEAKDQRALIYTTQTPDLAFAKSFVPAANDFTVHSQRNRKALENQKKQTNRPSERSSPTFEHKLLLGHVSMLTDIALVGLGGRNYILSADRDEHIRVSRGIPQAHIIEGFCLSHTQFISILCVPKERSDVLISGGGDDDVFLWNWVSGQLISRTDLKTYVVAMMQQFGAESRSNIPAEVTKIAVSGIFHARNVGKDGPLDFIVITCEGIPALFIFILTAQKNLQYVHTLVLSGNALAIVTDVSGGLIVSVDGMHNPGSTTELRDAGDEKAIPLQKFVFQENELIPSSMKFEFVKENKDIGKGMGQMTSLLYSLENLRKRDGDMNDEA